MLTRFCRENNLATKGASHSHSTSDTRIQHNLLRIGEGINIAMNLFSTGISRKSKERVQEVLNSTFVSSGNLSKEFEKSLSDKLNLRNPVLVNSGTSALHLGLEVSNIKTGDEVILPAQTFIASGLSILMTGATPVFADIQYETGNIDPESIKKKITDRTRAIMPVHWAGYPCDMDEIHKIATDFNLVVLEDAAHALGAVYKDKFIGAISDFTAFSFQAIKHLTTGDGGALCCLNKESYAEAKKRSWFGIDRENSKPSMLGERVFDIDKIGFKYHMNDIAAAIGLGNLDEFPMQLTRIRKNADTYRNELCSVSGLKLLAYKNDRKSSYWLFTMLVENREGFIRKMKEAGIPVSVIHQRIDRFSIFKGITEGLLNQERFDDDQIAIPIHSDLTGDDIDKIVMTIKGGW